MTETKQYQFNSNPPHAENAVLSVRRQVLLRRYNRLLSLMALLGEILSNVQFNLCNAALSCDALRRSR